MCAVATGADCGRSSQYFKPHQKLSAQTSERKNSENSLFTYSEARKSSSRMENGPKLHCGCVVPSGVPPLDLDVATANRFLSG